jgi:hypothetical protein
MFLLTPILRRLVFLALLVALLAAAAEFATRKLLGAAVASAVSARIGSPVNVGFPRSPLLLGLVHARIDSVTVTARRVRVGGLGAGAVRATLRDVRVTSVLGLQGEIGSLTLLVRIGPAAVRRLLATRPCLGALTPALRASLTSSPRVLLFAGRIDLLPPHGRAAVLRMVPEVLGGSLRFVTRSVELAGRPLPAATVATASACTRTLTGLPFGAVLRSARAERGVMALTLDARNASLSAVG